jgi:hypothetical protein
MTKLRAILACTAVAFVSISGLAVAQNFSSIVTIFYHGAPQLSLADNNGYWTLWGGGNFHIRQGTTDRLFFNGGNGTANFSGGVNATGFNTSSSRLGKTAIAPIDEAAARKALDELTAVSYTRKDDPTGDTMLGFIAEDVPDLLATPKRDSLSSMDFAAVLVTVMQSQQREIAALRAEIAELKKQDN